MGSSLGTMIEKLESRLKNSAKAGFLSKHKSLRRAGRYFRTQISEFSEKWCQQLQLRNSESCEKLFQRFNVHRYAVLIDRTSSAIKIPKINSAQNVGFYSFDSRCFGKRVEGYDVIPISCKSCMPDLQEIGITS